MIFISSCYHPLKAIVFGKNESGKKNIIFDTTAHDTGFYHGLFIPESDRLSLPCGQCVGCRIQRSREWANRLMLELQNHEEAWFLTLTYNDAHARPATDENGECHEWWTLCKRDFQLFMKRLRKATGSKLRFYACGEYGSQTQRPHYHAIIFGLHLDDLKVYKKSELGFLYYTSPFLDRVWSEQIERLNPETFEIEKVYDQIGYVIVGEVNWETCAYTARYVTKKLTGDLSAYYEFFDLEEPFSLMSRKPGIAGEYFQEHKEGLFDSEYIYLSTEKGGIKFKAPLYFKRLYAIDHETEIEEISKRNQRLAVEAKKIKLSKTNLSYDDLLAVEERAFEKRIKTLRRDIV